MPTVTAIALESLLEPGSSSLASHHHPHPRRHSTSDPAPPAPAPEKLQNHRHSTNGGRREQQPVFLSRRPREASHAAAAPADGGGRAAHAAGSRVRSSANGYYISPKLYATPEPTQIVPTGGVSSSSPTSVSSPSPYVVNHKRRDVPRRLPPSPPATTVAAAGNGNGAPSSSVVLASHLDGFDTVMKPPECGTGDTARGLSSGKTEGCSDGPGEEVVARGGFREGITTVGEQEGSSLDSKPINSGLAENERSDAGTDDDEDDDFFDPRELMSAVSSSDTDTSSFRRGVSGRCHTPLTNQSEFFDATEELARRQRQKRKLRRRWIWGCIGLSVAVGASLLAYSYLTHHGGGGGGGGGGDNPSLPSSEHHDPPFSGTMLSEGSST